MRSIAISSGHGKYVRGASGYIDEVDEARRVVNRVVELLQTADVTVRAFHDDVSTAQDENLERIVRWHDSVERDLDVSVHFNAFEATTGPRGTEVWYITQDKLAAETSTAIANASGLINRGAKYSNDLYFLNNTDQPAVLIEVCFVDSRQDSLIYESKFDDICLAIASTLSGTDEPVEELDSSWQRNIETTMFGGADDYNESAYPPYAYINDDVLGCALPCKWPDERPRVEVRNTANGKRVVVEILDVGPWMIDDAYWTTRSRPIAETCCENDTPLPSGPNAGKVPSNKAGLDLTPAAARAIGLSGKGVCDWRFA